MTENAINLKINGPDGTSVVDSEVKSVTVEIEDADSKDSGCDACDGVCDAGGWAH